MPARTIILFLSVVATVSLNAAERSPYFPERGRGALHQRAIDLRNPAVVLSIAAEPGHEDLATLTALRLGAGARVISMYVTNGTSTRSDLNGDLPTRVAARRKEEAYRALSHIGADVYFLNLPDYGIVDPPESLKTSWPRDSVVARVRGILRAYRPDVILLARDFRERTIPTARGNYIRELVLEAAARAATHARSDTGAGTARWKVERIFMETEVESAGLSVNSEAVHPVWRRSYRAIADEASAFYESLRLRIIPWNAQRARTYTLIRPRGTALPASFTSGVPILGNPMKGIALAVRGAAEEAEREDTRSALWRTADALRRIDSLYTARQKIMTNGERRVAAAWSIGLEKLRCSLLNIEIGLEVSDSLIAEGQLIYLKCTTLKGMTGKEKTEILFPGAMSQEWGINESAQFRYPFTVPSEYRLVSPQKLELNLPGAMHGINATAARVTFPIVIFHKDDDWTKNYVYRTELTFRAGPRRSAEIVSSVVRLTSGERLIIAMQNFSRDPFKGEITVGDSIIRQTRWPIALPVKDYLRTDTLSLAWADSVPDGDHVIECKIAGRSAGRFLARKFTVAADTANRVGLLTGISASPWEDALRRLHVSYTLLDPAALARGGLNSVTALVIDREALALRHDVSSLTAWVDPWVRAGGHLIMMPQYSVAGRESMLTGGITFTSGPALPPDILVGIASAHGLALTPNRLTEADWRDWIMARAEGSLRIEGSDEVDVSFRNGVTGTPLVATVQKGRGMITAVALNLIPQMQVVHPGVYRLIANLLSYRKQGS